MRPVANEIMNHSSESLDHPQRIALAGELHARPFMRIDPPARVLHLALFDGESLTQHPAWLAILCECFGVTPPVSGARYFSHDFGPYRLKWENHAEFSTYTFVLRDSDGPVFAESPLAGLPQSWLSALKGYVISATQLSFIKGPVEPSYANDSAVHDCFVGTVVAGARVMAGAEAWSEFLVQPDGVGRFLLRDVSLREFQAGRLTQRVLEIDTYRMMALLALPVAQQCQPAISIAEADLAVISRELAGVASPDEEQSLLERLTRLSASIEAMVENNNYRFSAADAYFNIVRARLQELREERIEGAPTFGEFMDRRLVPAIDFCASVRRRQGELVERLSRADSLLRTRVTMTQERNNAEILVSLNQRAAVQLRLQQTVEGFSTVAISYYLLGLSNYLFKSLDKLGFPVNVDIASGIAIPVVIVTVWFGVRRIRHSLVGQDASTH